MKISHIGIAVKSIEEALKKFGPLLNAGPVSTEVVADQKVKVASVRLESGVFELTEATSPDSPIAKFIDRRGEGIHHISLEVEDIAKELERLKRGGFQLIDEKPRRGAGGCLIAFIHPKSTSGVLVELSQKVA